MHMYVYMYTNMYTHTLWKDNKNLVTGILSGEDFWMDGPVGGSLLS